MGRVRIPTVLVAAVLVAACASGETPAATADPRYSLRRDGVVGHCLLGGDGIYTPVDCSVAHTIEVIATMDYSDDAAYPGGGIGLPLQFFDDCDAGFASYVGVAPDRSPRREGELRSVPIIPSVEVWNDGDRHVVCTVRGDRPWTGTVRGIDDLMPPGEVTDLADLQTPTCWAWPRDTGP
jgi:hypothetical protein